MCDAGPICAVSCAGVGFTGAVLFWSVLWAAAGPGFAAGAGERWALTAIVHKITVMSSLLRFLNIPIIAY